MPDQAGNITIRHCSDREFLDSFRADLTNAMAHATILSPFVSPNRAAYYYAALQSLAVRSVPVDVYARPRQEQPHSLREQFGNVERRLRAVGVRFHLRPAMHEKVAVLDGCVLWHGSLNILSHNDTRESMLRIESAKVATLVLADLGIQDATERSSSAVLGEEANAAGAPRSDPPAATTKCPVCRSSMRRYPEIALWICSRGPACPGTQPLDSVEAPQDPGALAPTGEPALACPLCQSPLTVRRGAATRIACSDAQCAFALEPRLARWLLKALRGRTPP